jgi:RNA polymerase sigma factor (sigma-70 family)
MAPILRRLYSIARASPDDRTVPLTECSDDELMALACSGKDGAFDTLIARHHGRVVRLAFRYVGDSTLAADIAQDTFMELLRALPRYRAEGKFSSFLFRILLNQCRMTRRSVRAEGKALDAVTASQESAPTGLFTSERAGDVEAALQTLSPVLRETVMLRFGADLSFQEIAETLEIPVGTAKRRVFEAMGKLREVLEEQ